MSFVISLLFYSVSVSFSSSACHIVPLYLCRRIVVNKVLAGLLWPPFNFLIFRFIKRFSSEIHIKMTQSGLKPYLLGDTVDNLHNRYATLSRDKHLNVRLRE